MITKSQYVQSIADGLSAASERCAKRRGRTTSDARGAPALFTFSLLKAGDTERAAEIQFKAWVFFIAVTTDFSPKAHHQATHRRAFVGSQDIKIR